MKTLRETQHISSAGNILMTERLPGMNTSATTCRFYAGRTLAVLAGPFLVSLEVTLFMDEAHT